MYLAALAWLAWAVGLSAGDDLDLVDAGLPFGLIGWWQILFPPQALIQFRPRSPRASGIALGLLITAAVAGSTGRLLGVDYPALDLLLTLGTVLGAIFGLLVFALSALTIAVRILWPRYAASSAEAVSRYCIHHGIPIMLYQRSYDDEEVQYGPEKPESVTDIEASLAIVLLRHGLPLTIANPREERIAKGFTRVYPPASWERVAELLIRRSQRTFTVYASSAGVRGEIAMIRSHECLDRAVFIGNTIYNERLLDFIRFVSCEYPDHDQVVRTLAAAAGENRIFVTYSATGGGTLEVALGRKREPSISVFERLPDLLRLTRLSQGVRRKLLPR